MREKTNTIKDTNSPEYNETFHIPISRQSRTLLRIFKAKVIKFEVWAKGYVMFEFLLFILLTKKNLVQWISAKRHINWDSIRQTCRPIESLPDSRGCRCKFYFFFFFFFLKFSLFLIYKLIYQLMDGRKPVGGKLEIKLRLRDPIVGKEMEQVQEKWTVLTS